MTAPARKTRYSSASSIGIRLIKSGLMINSGKVTLLIKENDTLWNIAVAIRKTAPLCSMVSVNKIVSMLMIQNGIAQEKDLLPGTVITFTLHFPELAPSVPSETLPVKKPFWKDPASNRFFRPVKRIEPADLHELLTKMFGSDGR